MLGLCTSEFYVGVLWEFMIEADTMAEVATI